MAMVRLRRYGLHVCGARMWVGLVGECQWAAGVREVCVGAGRESYHVLLGELVLAWGGARGPGSVLS